MHSLYFRKSPASCRLSVFHIFVCQLAHRSQGLPACPPTVVTSQYLAILLSLGQILSCRYRRQFTDHDSHPILFSALSSQQCQHSHSLRYPHSPNICWVYIVFCEDFSLSLDLTKSSRQDLMQCKSSVLFYQLFTHLIFSP